MERVMHTRECSNCKQQEPPLTQSWHVSIRGVENRLSNRLFSAAPTSFQERFIAGHAETAHNTVGLKIVHQSRMTTKTEQMSLRVNGRDNLFSFQLLSFWMLLTLQL
jgi:hypothetical protein